MDHSALAVPEVAGVPVAFVLFGLTLLGVAIFHHHTLRVALVGLAVILIFKLTFSAFDGVTGVSGLIGHLDHEWVVLVNLGGLLMGFSMLSDHFSRSRLPGFVPALLPDDWRGPAMLLLLVFVMSSFLDNIAAAIIGGATASTVFRGKVHIGYLAAIVAAANAGGAGSVIGDTTTTMMWIEGVSPVQVVSAYIPAIVALLIFGVPAARMQQRLSPIVASPEPGLRMDWARLIVVAVVLSTVIATNVVVNSRYPQLADGFPFLGVAVWIALLMTAPWRAPDWRHLRHAARGSLFLLALVTAASMMPVDSLPEPSWQSTLGLGFVSSVFDNIPLTKLALEQGGYDWGALAFAVGFGGSMVWFGSSAGVAITNQFPEARSVVHWIRYGWPVPLGFLAGYLVLIALLGWHPAEIQGPGH